MSLVIVELLVLVSLYCLINTYLKAVCMTQDADLGLEIHILITVILSCSKGSLCQYTLPFSHVQRLLFASIHFPWVTLDIGIYDGASH